MPEIAQILDAIEQRLTQAHAEIDSLTTAREILAGAPASSTSRSRARTRVAESAAPRSERAKSRRSRRSRRTGEHPEQTIEALLGESTAGISAVALSKRAGMGYARVLHRLHELESAGTVLSTGTNRTSLWRLVTDEDRIAQRVAELERASARS